jgi:hypothetical protein
MVDTLRNHNDTRATPTGLSTTASVTLTASRNYTTELMDLEARAPRSLFRQDRGEASSDRIIGVLRQVLATAELLERASALNSPVAGRVQQLEVNTFGQVVQTG